MRPVSRLAALSLAESGKALHLKSRMPSEKLNSPVAVSMTTPLSPIPSAYLYLSLAGLVAQW
jgi:hypothetical protein